MFLLVIFSILGYCFLVSRHTRFPSAALPLFVVCVLIDVLYIAALFQSLEITALILYIAA